MITFSFVSRFIIKMGDIMFTSEELTRALQGDERVADSIVSYIMNIPVDDSKNLTKIGAMCEKWLKTLPDYEYDDLINLARTYIYACLGFMDNQFKVKYDTEMYEVDPERFIRYCFIVLETRVFKSSYREQQKSLPTINVDHTILDNVLDSKLPSTERAVMLSMAFDRIIQNAKGKDKLILEGVLSYFRGEHDIDGCKSDTWVGAAALLKRKYGLKIYPFVLAAKVRKSCKSLSVFC